ncbi:MAG: Flp pilus assembly protein CpaB [Myxococcaceae bacterium]|nr:Flp pilus assembly protein CpaB [Myxococcaceae bacterium]
MSTEQQPMWVEWVDAARGGDVTAREELASYFTPFVHAVLSCQLATQHANEQTALVLDDALAHLAEAPSAAAFGPWLLERARVRGRERSYTPGTTLELPGGGAVMTEGKKVLSRLRHLPEPRRERLAFRLLEGITGAEISEVTGAGPAEVRGDLEQGLAALVQELGGVSVNAIGDAYLWSLVGTPHPAVVPLENQLTPLRYDPSAPAPALEPALTAPPAYDNAGRAPEVTPIQAPGPLQHAAPEVTPVQAPSPLERRSGEGRRQTSPEMKLVRPAPVPEDEPQTTPIGQPLVEDPTRVVGGADSSAEDKTRHATDLPVAAAQNPFDAQPGTIPATDLPVAAASNPFAAQPGTIPASDLPVAAGIDRASRPLVPAHGADDLGTSRAPPTRLKPRTMEVPAHKPPPPVEDDATAPRGTPLSILAREHKAAPAGATPRADPGQDWRASPLERETTRVGDAAAKPQPFSFTRGATPFAIAGVLLVFFGFITYINVRTTERNVRRGWTLVPIVVASQNIAEGSIIDYGMLSIREVPDSVVTSSVVKPDSSAYVLNQRIMVPVQAGDPLLWTQFESQRSKTRLSPLVNKKARAYTIEAEDIVSVGGWVQPGDHVDLIISVKDPESGEQVARTSLQNIQVIATGKIIATTHTGFLKAGQQKYGDVSVLALPEEVEMLALTKDRAKYSFVLRNDDDIEMTPDGLTRPDTLLSGERVKQLQKKRNDTINVIRSQVPAPTR